MESTLSLLQSCLAFLPGPTRADIFVQILFTLRTASDRSSLTHRPLALLRKPLRFVTTVYDAGAAVASSDNVTLHQGQNFTVVTTRTHCVNCAIVLLSCIPTHCAGPSRWPRSLKHRSAAAWLLVDVKYYSLLLVAICPQVSTQEIRYSCLWSVVCDTVFVVMVFSHEVCEVNGSL
jgi:hypothetical protein